MSNELPTVATARLLEGARYEVMPTASIAESVARHVPTTVALTVTAAPGKGLGATLDLATGLAAQGYHVVPHLAARMVTGRAELVDVVARLAEAGITAVFVPGGDADPPAGDYTAALDLLQDLATIEHPFTHVGITGYPVMPTWVNGCSMVARSWSRSRAAV